MRAAIACALASLVALSAPAFVSAQPSVPATFYGSVTVDGAPAEAGAEVRGLIDGVDCTQSPPGVRPVIREGEIAAYVLYVVHDSQRPGCARDGALVTFTIDGRPAVQTATWKPGPLRLDLSTGDAPPIPLPSPTGTVASAIQTATNPTPGATVPGTLPTGTPPTDDEHDFTPVPGGTPQTPAAGEDSDDGSSGLVILLVGLAVLAIAGGALGIVLARRQRAREA